MRIKPSLVQDVPAAGADARAEVCSWDRSPLPKWKFKCIRPDPQPPTVPMRRTPTGQRRAFQVVIWTIAWCLILQMAATLLPGYPWRDRTQPELAVKSDRYQRSGAWIRPAPTLEESIIQWQVHHLLTSVPTQEVMFVGDSSCLMGIVPERITERTGLSAWNLGTVGSLSTRGHARILELYLQRHPSRQSRLVVCYLAPSTLRRSAEQVDSSRVLDLFREWLDGSDAGQSSQAPLAQLPGYRLRRPTHAAVDSLLDDWGYRADLSLIRGHFPSDESVREALLVNRGYLPEPRKQTSLPSPHRYRPPLPTEDSLQGIAHMFEVTRDHSVNLLFVMTPLPESYRNSQYESEFLELESQLSKLAEPFTHITICKPFLRYCRDADFGSLHHLTRDAAMSNSDRIAAMIEQTVLPDRDSHFDYAVRDP